MSGPSTVLALSRPSRRRRVWWIVGAVAAAAVLAVSTVGFLVISHFNHNISSQDLNSAIGPGVTRPPAPGNGALNILLIGSDTRAGQGDTFGNVAGARSDTTILLHISADRTRAVGVSIPRDLIVDIPATERACGKQASDQHTRFNAAFSIGGAACTVRTVEKLTDIRIDHFVVIDFRGFEHMVSALGGVTVTVPQAIDDPMSGLRLTAGTHLLNGTQALAFVRARYTLTGGSDLGRIKRQQQFLTALAQKASDKKLLLRPDQLYSFLDAATASVTTDSGLGSVNSLAKLALEVRGISPQDIVWVTLPYKPDPQNPKATLVINGPQARALLAKLRADEPVSAPSPSPSP